jgi:2,3-dimethylmalate lyase
MGTADARNGAVGAESAGVSPGQRFRELLARPGMLLMPGAYDALSARIIAAHGFEAIVCGGFAAAGSLRGEPDVGQMTMQDYVDQYGRIAQAVDVPVFVDADTGFGGVNNVRRAIKAFEGAGVAGLFIEDQAFPKRCGYLPGKTLIPVEEMVAKIHAALDARKDSSFYFVARTDALGVDGIDAAIERAHLYMAAGADMAFVQGADTIESLTRVCHEVPGPQLANVSQARGKEHLPLAKLEKTGAAACTFPSLALFAAVAGVERAISALADGRPLDEIGEGLISLNRYNELVGLDEHNAREERFEEAGRTSTSGR